MPGSGFIDLTLTGDDGVVVLQRRIQTWEHRLTDMSEPLEQVGGDLLHDFTNNMMAGGGYYGPWSPLQPATWVAKERRGETRPLISTGEMLTSLTVRGAPDNIFEVTPNSLRVGSRNFKAPIHHRGAPRAHIPARPLIGWTWNAQSQVVRRFVDWVNRITAS